MRFPWLSPKALKGAPVAGVIYAAQARNWKGVVPYTFWSGRLVHSQPMNQTYVVLALSNGNRLTLAIFPVDPKRTVGKYPLDYPVERPESWTKPLQAVAETQIRQDLMSAVTIQAISVVPDRKTLLIAAQPMSTWGAPLYFRYDFEKKTWSKAKVVAGEVLK